MLVISPCAFAGQITFKNGDHLTGTVTSSDEDKLTIDSKFAGKITVPLKDVASFTTDAPIKATLSNGSVIKAPVTTVATTEPSAPSVASRTVAMSDISKVAPATLAQPWTGDVLVGATIQTGNTHAAQVNASADAVRRWEESRLTLEGQYLFGRQRDKSTGDENTTSDYAEAHAKYDYFLTKKFYLYGMIQGQHDGVADLVIRISPNVGVGYQWHESPIWNFSTDAGLGWTYEEYSPGGSDEYVSARLAYHYDRKLTSNLSFVHNLEYLPSLEDVNRFIINADAGLRADISKAMFTEFKVQWNYNNDPPKGTGNNDLRYLASLGWHF